MAQPLAEKLVQSAIALDALGYCPTMDLVALATTDGSAHVFRLNGQEVFAVLNRNPEEKTREIRWKPNGIVRTPLQRISLLTG